MNAGCANRTTINDPGATDMQLTRHLLRRFESQQAEEMGPDMAGIFQCIRRPRPEVSGPSAAAAAVPDGAAALARPTTGALMRPVFSDFSVKPMEWSMATCTVIILFEIV